MDYFKMNDYEVIYLIRCGSEEAREIMIEKYRKLISKNITSFHFKEEYEDYFQEGLMVLVHSIDEFDEHKGPFPIFYNNNLVHRFIDLKKKKINRKNRITINNLILEETHSPYGVVEEEYGFFNGLTEKEKDIIKLRCLNKYSVEYIAKKYDTDIKSIYNLIARIRKKIKENINY